MTTQESWRTDYGVPVYTATEIRQPYSVPIEGALVVELPDYRAIERLFDEAVALLCDAYDYMVLGSRPEDLTLKIKQFLATQDV